MKIVKHWALKWTFISDLHYFIQHIGFLKIKEEVHFTLQKCIISNKLGRFKAVLTLKASGIQKIF
jgi:hypothetical protein